MAASLKSIADVGLDGVLAVEDGSNPALCPRRSTDIDAALADDGDTTMVSQPKRCRLTGKSATNDKDVKAMGHDKEVGSWGGRTIP